MDSEKDKKIQPQKVGLALGGGGAKGLAHIGVIEILLDADIKIDYIAGTSMGALVGGWYAAKGEIESLKKLFLNIGRKDVVPLPQIIKKKTGMIFRKNAMVELLQKELGNIKIEDCELPFRAIATDAESGDEVIISKGSLAEAIRASTALPIIFRPVEHENRILVDGGFVNPVPADIVRSMGAEFVIAVDVSSKWLDLSPQSTDIKNLEHIHSVVSSALTMIEYQIARTILKGANLVLRPTVMNFSWLDFDQTQEIIRRGRKETRENLTKIRDGAGYPEPEENAAKKFWKLIFPPED